MNEIEAIGWQLGRYRAVLVQQIDRLYNALAELQRTTLLLHSLSADPDEKVDEWLNKEGFAVDDDGFYQSMPMLISFRQGTAQKDAVSY